MTVHGSAPFLFTRSSIFCRDFIHARWFFVFIIAPDVSGKFSSSIGSPKAIRRYCNSNVDAETAVGDAGMLFDLGMQFVGTSILMNWALVDVMTPYTPFTDDMDFSRNDSQNDKTNTVDNDVVTMETETSRVVPSVGNNPAQVQTFKKDTVVHKADIQKVKNNDNKEKQKADDQARRQNNKSSR